MTLRPTLASARTSTRHAPALDYEIAQEQASALGRLGRALEAALAALAAHDRDYDSDHAEPSGARTELVQDASNALWCFMVQREAVGLRDPRPVFRDYCIPTEVRNRMGVFGGQRRKSVR